MHAYAPPDKRTAKRLRSSKAKRHRAAKFRDMARRHGGYGHTHNLNPAHHDAR